jgi:hypothetical protein
MSLCDTYKSARHGQVRTCDEAGRAPLGALPARVRVYFFFSAAPSNVETIACI